MAKENVILEIDDMDEFFERNLHFWDLGFDAAVDFIKQARHFKNIKRDELKKTLLKQWAGK